MMVTPRKTLGRVILIVILLLIAVITLFPFYWNINAAFLPVDKIFNIPPKLWPGADFTIANAQRLYTLLPQLFRNLFNSVFLAVIIPVLSLLVNSMAGFALSKYRFKGDKIFFGVIIGTMLLPTTANYIPLFIEMAQLKLVDNYLAIILPGISGAFWVFLFRQTIFSIPDELLDAGRIDGAMDVGLYFKIVLPLIKPMATTMMINSIIGVWNDYFWPFIVLRSNSKLTFTVGLAGLQGLIFNPPWGAIMFGAVVLTVPTLIIFIVLSKYIIPDVFSGSIKG